MNQRNYPIVLGVNGEANKCIVRANGKKSFYICWLKENAGLKIGDEDFPVDKIGGVIAEIMFASRGSLKAMIKSLQEMDANWQEVEE